MTDNCTLPPMLRVLMVFFVLLLGVSQNTFAQSLTDKEIQSFVSKMHKKHGLSVENLTRVMREAKILDSVLEAMSKPAEGLPWYKYRPIFVKQSRIEAGVEFWNEHNSILKLAEERFGVPPEIVVAIIGVETFYGRHAGKNRVLDSLSTLSFRYPRRSAFFTAELESLLLLMRDENLDPLTTNGSYAGAMGIPQFIASSYRHYAIDFDNDGVRDLLNSVPDAIGSVANYLSEHGWRRGELIALPVSVKAGSARELIKKGIKPQILISELRQNGVQLYSDVSANSKAALIEYELADGVEHWLGMKNFYVITRYNHSALYGLAVFQLAQAIKEMRTS